MAGGHRCQFKINMHHSITSRIGSSDITIETGKLAKLADGAVTVRCGDTIVLVTAVSATTLKEGQDWFPLSVDYREKAAAVGKFPGGYFKREGRPTEKEILTSRMTDRPLRPLFPKGYLYDTQIITVLLSADGQNDPDMLSINGASAALMVSDIPFNGPVGAVRVGRVNGQFVVNPTHKEREESDLDLVYVGTQNDVIMIEGAAKELPEEEFVKALDFAHPFVQQIIAMQNELAAKAAKEKRQLPLMLVKDELLEIAYHIAGDRIEAALYTQAKWLVVKRWMPSNKRSRLRFWPNTRKPLDSKFHRRSIICRRKHSGSVFSTGKCVATDVVTTISVRSQPRLDCCHVLMDPQCSHAAKPKRLRSRHWHLLMNLRNLTVIPAAKPPSVSSCTITSLHSASVKLDGQGLLDAAKSGTAHWPNVRLSL